MGSIPPGQRHYRNVTQPYVPLRVFSSFTMLEGAMEPKAIAERAVKLGFPAVGLTDRNGLYAAMAFTEACSGKGVQPIVGAMLAVARPPETGSTAVDWIVLLAKDEQGYGNLCHLVSSAHLDRPVEFDPHVAFAALEKSNQGLIALTAGSEGALSRLLADGQKDKAKIYLDRLQTIFPDRLYVEIIRRNDPGRRGVGRRSGRSCVRAGSAAGRHQSGRLRPIRASIAAHDAMLCIAQSLISRATTARLPLPKPG
jgi:DNA polymerase-3 subunit alpha